MKSVSEEIGDPRILELLKKYINTGYVDKNGTLYKPEHGTPQGGILSPLLANVVLHRLDKFMQEEKNRFDKGNKRRKNPAYASLQAKKGKSSDLAIRKKVLAEMRKVRRSDAFDPNYRRLKYIRYADDFVVLIAGPLQDARHIRAKVKDVLKAKCGLELNPEKTSINNMTERWNFLGAEIRKLKANET